MIIPRELAELRVLTANVNRNDKKMPRPFSVRNVAPWTLFHDERDQADEDVGKDVAQAFLDTMPPQRGKIKVVSLSEEAKESCQDNP